MNKIQQGRSDPVLFALPVAAWVSSRFRAAGFRVNVPTPMMQNLPFYKTRLNHSRVSVVLTNPEPHKVIIEFHGEGAIFKRHPRGPEFLSAAFG